MGGLSALASLTDTAITGNYYRKVLYYRPIAYWPLWETAGASARCLVNVAQNGSYTGVTLANAAGPDGNPVPFFDGATSYVNIYSAAFNTAFNRLSGSIALWLNMDVWAAVARNVCMFYVDALNEVSIQSDGGGAQDLYAYYRGGGVLRFTGMIGCPVADTWFHVAFTWNQPGNQIIAYLNAVPFAPVAGLGVMAGNLSITQTCIGASTTVPANVWHGWLAHCAMWDRVLSPAEILSIATT